jgi:hypothetical protein
MDISELEDSELIEHLPGHVLNKFRDHVLFLVCSLAMLML